LTIRSSKIIPRSGHVISRAAISENALKVLYRLKNAGFEAYLVGGCVRDVLLGREPKDFDVTTNAHPDEVRSLFRNCRLVGRRFRLAHVRFGREIIEVATFRAQHQGDAEGGLIENGMILRDNVYGTVEEDAWRRDFTVNALYYNINDFSVVDYTGGVEDLQAGLLSLLGEPEVRFREDPVRMLRAVRFAAKLGFRIAPATEEAMLSLGHLLADIPPARLFDEVLKLFLSGCAVQTYELLRHYGLFAYLFPATERCLSEEEEGYPHLFVLRALENTDRRIEENKPVTPAFLFATLLWEPVRALRARYLEEEMTSTQAMQSAGSQALSEQMQHVMLPRRFGSQAREIWQMQSRLTRTTGTRRALRLLPHPRFRAAYDFLLLRAQAGEAVQEDCDWWTRCQEADEQERSELCSTPKKRRRRRQPAKARGETP